MAKWMQGFENRKITPLDLKVEQVGSITEIAHALACKARFTGHTREPYSVAEHCVRGADLLPLSYAGAFLLHELSEVYLPDIPSPIKPSLTVEVEDGKISWSELEARHLATMLEALGLASLEPLIYSPEVRGMDLAMLLAEKRDLMGPEPEPWGIDAQPAATGRIVPMGWKAARDAFLNTYARLFGRPVGVLR